MTFWENPNKWNIFISDKEPYLSSIIIDKIITSLISKVQK
jgi:hypothetical protein